MKWRFAGERVRMVVVAKWGGGRAVGRFVGVCTINTMASTQV